MPRRYMVIQDAPESLLNAMNSYGSPQEATIYPPPGFYWSEERSMLYYVAPLQPGMSIPVVSSMGVNGRPDFSTELPGSNNIDVHMLLDQLIDLQNGGRRAGG